MLKGIYRRLDELEKQIAELEIALKTKTNEKEVEELEIKIEKLCAEYNKLMG